MYQLPTVSSESQVIVVNTKTDEWRKKQETTADDKLTKSKWQQTAPTPTPIKQVPG